MRSLRTIALILSVPVVFFLAAAFFVYWQLNQPSGKDLVFDIPPGDNLSSITARLDKNDVLAVDPLIFKAVALSTRDDGAIQAGQYEVTETMNVFDLLALFRSGRVIQYRVTFPEGWTLGQWQQEIEEAPYLVSTRPDPDVLAANLGITGPAEGWFFPDTYQYVKGDSDQDIYRRAYQRMSKVLKQEWQARSGTPHINNMREALTLASIVEKETGYEPDRGKIASVFHNRMISGMKLQSDPTVIYGLGDAFDGDLKRSHLRADTPYNSYTRAGLPPGAICSPGRASIRAVMRGSEHPYLYFVARGDGRSYFSMTLEEHNDAVDRFQRKRNQ